MLHSNNRSTIKSYLAKIIYIIVGVILISPIYAASTCSLTGDPPNCLNHEFDGSTWTFKNDSSFNELSISNIESTSNPGSLIIENLSNCQPFTNSCTVKVFTNKPETSGQVDIKVNELNPFNIDYKNLDPQASIEWSKPQNPSEVTSGNLVEAKVKPDGAQFCACNFDSVNGQLRRITKGDNIHDTQCPVHGDFSSECYVSFRVKKVKFLNSNKKAQIELTSANLRSLTTKSVDVLQNEIEVSHTFATEPDSNSHDNYFIIKNVSPTGRNLPSIDFNVSLASQPDLGDGVKLDRSTESSSSNSVQAIQTCSSMNDSLDPNQKCKVPLQVDKDAYGSVFVKISGNFIRQSIKEPINVAPVRVKVFGHFTNQSEVLGSGESPFLIGNPPGKNGLTLENKGPFNIKNLQLSTNVEGPDISVSASGCDTSNVKLGDKCTLDFTDDDLSSPSKGHFEAKSNNRGVIYKRYLWSGGLSRFTNDGKGNSSYSLLLGSPNINPPLDSLTLLNHLNQAIFVLGGYSSETAKIESINQRNQNRLTSWQKTNKCSGVSGNSFCPDVYVQANLKADEPLTRFEVTHVKLDTGGVEGLPKRSQIGFAERSLVIGGDFSNIKGLANSTAIARYGRNGNWHYLATLSKGDSVNALLMDRDLYAAGHFKQISNSGDITKVTHIARWDGAQWQPLGEEFNDDDIINALASVDDKNGAPTKIFLGGDFDGKGNNFVIRNPQNLNWTVPANSPNGPVNTLLVGPNNLIWVGGSFTQINNNGFATGIASYDHQNDSWSKLASNLEKVDSQDIQVNSLVYDADLGDQGSIIAGGKFKICDDDCSFGLAVYDLKKDNGWKPFFPNSPNHPSLNKFFAGIKTLLVHKDSNNNRELLVGGEFLLDGKKTNYARYRYNKNSWDTSINVPNGMVNTQLINSEHLFVGGDFSSLQEKNVSNLAMSSTDHLGYNWQALTSPDKKEISDSGNVIEGGAIKAMTFMDRVFPEKV